jgi:ribosome-associated protein
LKSNDIIKKITEILEEKKAKEISIIDIKKLEAFTDYFVICTGTSNVHIRSICDYVKEKLEQIGMENVNIGGYDSANWIVIDYGSILIHIFDRQSREFYNIERLWFDGILTTLK